ncbi:hypothetical protein ACFFWC_18390 [Plantactinospora siamensis]|uniref:SMI1/KNR4 family protein n=1 Tax=Plantactinospora siamensis TaxID=555372 RepID=A0ABV6NQ61_9ACTN
MVDPDAQTRADLETLLPEEGFRPECYRLYGGEGVGHCYVIDHAPAGWEVYYSDSGTKANLKVFPTEAGACSDFLARLRLDPSTRHD